MKRTRAPKSIDAILPLVLLAAACGQPPVDGVLTAHLAGEGSVRDRELAVSRGRAMAFVAQPVRGDEPVPVRMRLESDDPAVAQVERLPDMNQFVVIGVRRGSTKVRMLDEAGRTSPAELLVEVR